MVEAKLSGPIGGRNEPSGGCDPAPGAPVDCVGATIDLKRESALLVIATASKSGGARIRRLHDGG